MPKTYFFVRKHAVDHRQQRTNWPEEALLDFNVMQPMAVHHSVVTLCFPNIAVFHVRSELHLWHFSFL
jgi:hypothetical protein